jgi:thiol-disulfide isomerase/thioredoxin
MKNQIAISVLIIASAILGFYSYTRLAEDALPIVSDPIISEIVTFTLPDLEGNLHHLSDWDGKARIVNFWATWCAPCRREIPLLKNVQAKYAESNLQVIGVAVDFLEEVVEYAEIAEFNYPILIGQEDAIAAVEAMGISFIGMPFTMMVSPDGYLIKIHIGELIKEHIELIVEVFDQMQNAELNLEGARSALQGM